MKGLDHRSKNRTQCGGLAFCFSDPVNIRVNLEYNLTTDPIYISLRRPRLLGPIPKPIMKFCTAVFCLGLIFAGIFAHADSALDRAESGAV